MKVHRTCWVLGGHHVEVGWSSEEKEDTNAGEKRGRYTERIEREGGGRGGATNITMRARAKFVSAGRRRSKRTRFSRGVAYSITRLVSCDAISFNPLVGLLELALCSQLLHHQKPHQLTYPCFYTKCWVIYHRRACSSIKRQLQTNPPLVALALFASPAQCRGMVLG